MSNPQKANTLAKGNSKKNPTKGKALVKDANSLRTVNSSNSNKVVKKTKTTRKVAGNKKVKGSKTVQPKKKTIRTVVNETGSSEDEMDIDNDLIVELNENSGTNKSSLTDADLLRIAQFISMGEE